MTQKCSLVFNKMLEWKCVRNILIVISFAIFVMQTYEAMIKYWKSPTVIINSETSGTDKPSVMITEVYFDGKQVVQNMVVKPNDNGNNRKNFVGLKLKFQVVK